MFFSGVYYVTFHYGDEKGHEWKKLLLLYSLFGDGYLVD